MPPYGNTYGIPCQGLAPIYRIASQTCYVTQITDQGIIISEAYGSVRTHIGICFQQWHIHASGHQDIFIK